MVPLQLQKNFTYERNGIYHNTLNMSATMMVDKLILIITTE